MGRKMSSPGWRVEDGVPEVRAGRPASAECSANQRRGQLDVGALQRAVKPLGEHGLVAGHDELVVGAGLGQAACAWSGA